MLATALDRREKAKNKTHAGDAVVLHQLGVSFVEPDDVPPLARHVVARPLVGQFVSDHLGHVVFVDGRVDGGVVEQIALPGVDTFDSLSRCYYCAERKEAAGSPVDDETPVFHGASIARHGGHVLFG